MSLVAAVALAGCAGGGDAGGPAAEPVGSPTVASAAEVEGEDSTRPTEPGGPTADEPPASGEAGLGTATVEVDGETFTFGVIQCLRDVPGFMGGTMAFQLDGTPPDTPADLVEPLMGPVDPDSDIQAALAPVFEVGPILSVSRVTDGGDLVALSTGPGTAYVTTANATDADERFLDISEATSGATVQGTSEVTTPSGTTADMSLEAVCP